MRSSRFDRTALIGLVTVVLGAAAAGVVFSGKADTIFKGSPEQTVTARFANTNRLRAGDEVRIAGVKVGEVDDVDLAPDARSTLVKMKIDDAGGPIYQDATASVRWKTLLGAAVYVRLQRGSARTGELGSHIIPLANTTDQVELDDITSVIRGRARTGLQRLPGELATALDDPHVVADSLQTLQRVSPGVRQAANALRGVRPDHDLRRLVHGTSRTVAILGRQSDELRRLVAGAAATLGTTADNREQIRDSLRLAPPMMRETNVTLDRLRTTLNLADPLVRSLRRSAPRVAPTLADLRPTVMSADRLLRRAEPLLVDLRPTLQSVARLSRNGLPVLRELTPTLERLEQSILPALARKWPETGISTTVMAGAALAGLGGIAGQKDANGHFVRFPLTGGSGTVLLPCQAFPNNPDLTPAQQLQCQSLSKTLEQILSYNPLPR